MQRKESKAMLTAGRQTKTDLMEIRTYMEQHYAEPLSVEQLARMANISPKYFVDLFKKTYGQSAIDFLTDLRINRAKRYLTESEYRLREIAQKVGYSDEFYFSRKFKKEVGVSPSAFMKNPRQRIAACSASMIGQLLALDIVPVAAPLDSKWTPYYYNIYQSRIKVQLMVDGLGQKREWDKLVKARPDATIGLELLPDEVKFHLQQAGPALFVAAGHTSWREQLREIAQFLGREKQCEDWISGYEQKAELARQQVAQAVGTDTFIVLRLYGRSLHSYCNPGIRDVLYQDLRLAKARPEPELYNHKLTLEQLREMDPKRILLLVCPEAESRVYWLELQHNKEWRGLNAVRNGHVYPIPSDPWFEYSAVAVNRMLSETLLLLTGHCPNSPMDKVHGRV